MAATNLRCAQWEGSKVEQLQVKMVRVSQKRMAPMKLAVYMLERTNLYVHL